MFKDLSKLRKKGVITLMSFIRIKHFILLPIDKEYWISTLLIFPKQHSISKRVLFLQTNSFKY